MNDTPQTEGSQSDIGDHRLEDEALAASLEQFYRNKPLAQEHGRLAREAKKTITTLLETQHPEVINADDDGVHTGWVICGHFRFRPMKSTLDKKPASFTPGEQSSWEIEVEELSLGI